MEGVKSKQLFELKDSIKASQPQLLYLLDQHELTEEEMDLSSTTFAWPEAILSTIDESDMMMERAKTRGEETLMQKREVGSSLS